MKNIRFQKGYVALASILVIASVVTVIGISTSLLSVNEIQSSLSGLKNEVTVDFVEGCVEDALLRLNENNAIPNQISLPEGSCDVSNITQNGTAWTFTVSGTIDTYTKSVHVKINRDTTVTVTSWEEN